VEHQPAHRRGDCRAQELRRARPLALLSRAGLLLAATAFVGRSAVAQVAPQLLERMAGTWQVEERMWPGPDAAAVELPPAIAHRRLIGGKYLEEVMVNRDSKAPADAIFQRHSFLNFNAVTGRYEYSSLDTRAPQLMTELSAAVGAAPLGPDLSLQGTEFLAPQWGAARNVPFRYRLTLGELRDRRQTVRLYLTPQAVLPPREFLAFEYVYRKTR
jgi:Protein of unknown function (DUF1579)